MYVVIPGGPDCGWSRKTTGWVCGGAGRALKGEAGLGMTAALPAFESGSGFLKYSLGQSLAPLDIGIGCYQNVPACSTDKLNKRHFVH
jgi:hypothetical protein